MDNETFREKAVELYKNSVEVYARNLTLGCFLDNKCDITKCRSQDFQPEDSFIIKESNSDNTKYSDDYTITDSIIPGYIKINKKGRGECCPFYGFKCRFVLDAVFREIYGENSGISEHNPQDNKAA